MHWNHLDRQFVYIHGKSAALPKIAWCISFYLLIMSVMSFISSYCILQLRFPTETMIRHCHSGLKINNRIYAFCQESKSIFIKPKNVAYHVSRYCNAWSLKFLTVFAEQSTDFGIKSKIVRKAIGAKGRFFHSFIPPWKTEVYWTTSPSSNISFNWSGFVAFSGGSKNYNQINHRSG
jgi:hypothetical protein